uniref:Dolichyl-diphosphooligosaccharide--protein glycosyltransferase subunit 2 n=1 Tax=Ciona savignyi TaxID=51511 RepID=H2Z5M2_CIOSA
MDYKRLLTFLTCLGAANAAFLDSVITADNSKLLLSKFKAPYNSLEDAHHSVLGLKHYNQGGAIGSAESEAACKLVKSVDTQSLASLYQAATTLENIGSSCKHQFSAETLDFVKGKISETSDVKSIFEAVSVLKVAGKPVDNDEVIAALLAAVKSDNSVLSSSLALLTASKLTNPNLALLLKYVDVEDMSAQADEITDRHLHFDNDLVTTATFLAAVMSLPGKKLPVTNDQVVLFSNFLLSRKTSTASIKEASLLIQALGKVVASNKITVAKAQLVSGTSISESNPAIKVSITNMFGQPITKLAVKADSIIRASDNEVLASNAPFKLNEEQLNYQLLFWKNKPKSGFYDVTLAASGGSLVGVSDFEFRIKVTTRITLNKIELGTAEKEQVSPTLTSLKFKGKADVMAADTQQRVIMKFQVADATDGTVVNPHQAFVRFVSLTTGQEIIFVAEPDKTSTYKFEIDMASAGKEQFNSASGKYSMFLIVGDATISNPVFWHFGDINLKIGEAQKPKSSFGAQYSAKPEIHHIFRQPEERPPTVVSQAFTIACLFPVVLLFIMWAKVGANLGNLKLAPKNIIFHAGLTGIFILYYMCWLKLDMFTTVQYLFGIGAVTFVFGNSVLSDLANNR